MDVLARNNVVVSGREGGRPMVFVGSIEAPPGTFHDDARFYVFWSPEVGTRECVIQVA